ncbi:MAG: hypothetical protein IJO32_05670 [Bacilli bacterium]|nr:hypothetical protein [Bacilli bacterium]
MNYYNKIKEKLIKSEIYDRVKDYSKDRNKVNVYFEIGKLLSEAGKEYGKNIIKQYSEKLMIEVGKKYNLNTLYKMRKFYEVFSNEKLSTVWTILSWSHYRELIRLKNINEIKYYISICEQNNLSQRQLHDRIKNKEYERLSDEAKNKLMKSEKLKVNDLVPTPIIIKTTSLNDKKLNMY